MFYDEKFYIKIMFYTIYDVIITLKYKHNGTRKTNYNISNPLANRKAIKAIFI